MAQKDSSDPVLRYCVVFRQGRRVSEVALDQVSETLEQPDTFVWMALHEPDNEVLLRVQQEFDLHDLAIEDARGAHQRPKLEQYGNSLFIVMKTARLEHEKVLLGETQIFIGPNFFITIRHGPSVSYSSVRERLESAPEHITKGPAMALYSVLDFIVDNYHPVLQALQDKFDQLEADIFRSRFSRGTITRLYQLKHELLELRSAAAPVLDITDALMHLHHEIIPKDIRVYFRDVHDHVTRLVAGSDEIREMSTTAMQVNLAFVSVEQNEAVRRLAGWGAILAVPTVVFSLYGMNFQYMPELKFHYGYPLVILTTGVICVWLYRRLKRYGWL